MVLVRALFLACGRLPSHSVHTWQESGRRKRKRRGTSLVVQWLRLNTTNSGGPGLIPGQGTRSHMWQLRVGMPPLQDLHAPMPTVVRAERKP